jgi:hypothetical protein
MRQDEENSSLLSASRKVLTSLGVSLSQLRGVLNILGIANSHIRPGQPAVSATIVNDELTRILHGRRVKA